MRKYILLLTVAILLVYSAQSQNSNYQRNFPNRYELDIPEEWNKPRLIEAITEILPKTLEELKGKEFCIDCKAGYAIKILINVPQVKSRDNISKGSERASVVTTTGVSSSPANYDMYYSMQVVYQFRAAMGLFDRSGKNIVDLVLVLPEEEHIKRKDTVMRSGDATVQEIRDGSGRIIKRLSIPGITPVPISNTLYPTMLELLNIAEQRVYWIKDVLKKKKVSGNS